VSAISLLPPEAGLPRLRADPSVDYRCKFRGALLGVGLGDALGRPAEGRSPETIRQHHGRIADFIPWRGWRGGPKGTFTDDTELTLALAESLIERREVDPADFARRCVAWLPVGRGRGRVTTEACERLAEGTPWQEAGTPSAGNGAAMRAAPIGLLHPLDVNALRRDAALSAVVTHADPTAALSAAAMAYLVADLVHIPPGQLDVAALLGRLEAAVGDFVDPPMRERRGGGVLVQLLPRLLEMGDHLHLDPDTLFAYTYNGALVTESLPAALWCFLRAPDDPRGVVLTAVNGGYDADTVAAMAGALAGAYNGADAWPTDWLDELEYRDGLEGCADDLLDLSGLPAPPRPEPKLTQVKTVDSFRGPYSFLSNSARIPIEIDGTRYPTLEHAYGAWRMADPDDAEAIRLVPTPVGAAVFRHLTATELRPVSDAARLDYMRRLLEAKFAPGSLPAAWLQKTGRTNLVNNVWWNDRFWGVVSGAGDNHLGRLLEEVRETRSATREGR
jgi:ADP-ribosylglycohydrolase/predicted NAD-dependent protein-ADP-ribosyltransferase YbiA (DUF1768 family)